ncbi:YsnF/AvaK domain-containing protein [Pontibacter sp. 13R65]|uniref:YsnF/AvaK domain-containing protein n=1 Tax=Pontibacter sp. 13R65 TaxID=3127458 RepID=UPI00301E583E
MSQTVVGIFDKGIDAQMAAQSLQSSNISPASIDILHNDSDSIQPSATAAGAAGIAPGATATPSQQSQGYENRDKSGSVSNFFHNLFDDKDEARKYTTAAQKSWIVTVHANSKEEAERVAETMDSCGAVDVEERSLRTNQGATGATTASSASTGSLDRDFERGETSIPIVEEHMQVGKRVQETGGVHLRSRILERPVEEKLRLREEHVFVERNPVNRPATEADIQNFKEGETRITEHAEVPIVNKEARVVEEVRVGKRTESHEETVRGTERKTEVDVDKLNPNRDSDIDREPGNPAIR